MRGIEAAQRLRELDEIIPYLENSVEMASDVREYFASQALSKVVGSFLAERDDLERRLWEVSV